MAKSLALSWVSQDSSTVSVIIEEQPSQMVHAAMEPSTGPNDALDTPVAANASQPQPRPKKKSPRKLLRRLSAADEVDKAVMSDATPSCSPAKGTSNRQDALESPRPVSPTRLTEAPVIVFHSQVSAPASFEIRQEERLLQTTTTPQTSPPRTDRSTELPRRPSAAPAGLHPGHAPGASSHEDMKRFVSSSTASGMSGTTAGSFVKHPGPPLIGQMRTIRPEEVQGVLPAKVGAMRYSTERQMWMKELEEGNETTSEDPFNEIESLAPTSPKSEHSGEVLDEAAEKSLALRPANLRDEEVAQNAEEIVDPEHDDRPTPPPPAINPDLRFDSDLTASTQSEAPTMSQEGNSSVGSRSSSVGAQPHQTELVGLSSDLSAQPMARSLEELSQGIANISLQMDLSPPRPARPTNVKSLPNFASANPFNKPQIFPRSVLKPLTPDSNGISQTPQRTHPDHSHRRSVSFSDGRKSGKIRGLASPRAGDETEETTTEPSQHNDLFTAEQPDRTLTFVPSTRTKRISNLLEGLADSTTGKLP